MSLEVCFFPQTHPLSRDCFPHLLLCYAGSQREKGLGRTFSSLCRLHSLFLSSVSYVTFVSSLLPGLETLVWVYHQMNTPYPTWIEECRCLRLRESGWRSTSLCGYLIILFLASLLTAVSWSKWNFWDFMWSVSCWVAHNDFSAFCLDEQQTHTYKLQLLCWASSGEWEWFGDLDHHWRNMWGIIKSLVEGLPW